MAVQRVRTAVFEIPWTGSGPELLPAHACVPRVLVAENDDEFRVLLRDELCREELEVINCTCRRLAG